MQVDVNQPDVPSMTYPGSSAASSGFSTRRSWLHDGMSSFLFLLTSVLLTCTKFQCDHMNQI